MKPELIIIPVGWRNIPNSGSRLVEVLRRSQKNVPWMGKSWSPFVCWNAQRQSGKRNTITREYCAALLEQMKEAAMTKRLVKSLQLFLVQSALRTTSTLNMFTRFRFEQFSLFLSLKKRLAVRRFATNKSHGIDKRLFSVFCGKIEGVKKV